jgi:tetratricopeptide (TPR) repeat protein
MKTYYPLFMKKISYIFLFSIISLSVFAIGDKDKNDSKSNLKSAEKALELGDKYQAIDLFEKVLSKESNVETAYKLGMLYYEIRDYKNAERCFELANTDSKINA